LQKEKNDRQLFLKSYAKILPNEFIPGLRNLPCSIKIINKPEPNEIPEFSQSNDQLIYQQLL